MEGIFIAKSMYIGQRIRYFRTLKHWSQEKLALAANINTAFLGHLERGLKSPTMKTLDKIISALGISYSEFFIAEPLDTNDEKLRLIEGILVEIRHLSQGDLASVAEIIHEIVKIKASGQTPTDDTEQINFLKEPFEEADEIETECYCD